MVGKVRVRGQGKVMKGRRQTTTTYKRGGPARSAQRFQKRKPGPEVRPSMKGRRRPRFQVGGVMPGVGAAGMARPLAAGMARPLAAGAAQPLAAGAARPVGGGVLPGARTMVKKGGSVKGVARGGAAGKRRPGGLGPAASKPKKKPTRFPSFVKGDPNTPGELRREIKGGLTMGRIRTKKVLRGDYDAGKKLRKQRKHHS